MREMKKDQNDKVKMAEKRANKTEEEKEAAKEKDRLRKKKMREMKKVQNDKVKMAEKRANMTEEEKNEVKEEEKRGENIRYTQKEKRRRVCT